MRSEKAGEGMNLKQQAYWFWNAAKGMRFPILLNSIIGILRVLASLMFVWTCKQLIDIATRTIEGDLRHYSILLVVVVVAELLLSSLGYRQENRNDIRLKNRLRNRLFSHVMLSTWDGKERFHSGDVLNRIEEDVRLLSEALCKTLPSILVVCFQMAAAFLFLTRLNTHMALVLVVIMPLFLLLSKFYIKRMRRLTKEIRATDSQVQSHIQEKVQHKVLIQTLSQHKTVSEKLSFFQHLLFGQTLKRINFTLFSRTLVMAGFITGYVTAFLWGVNGIYEGLITFGVMTAFLQLVGQVQRPMVDLSRYLPSLIQAGTSVERLKELVDLPLEEQGDGQILEGEVGIRMSNVSFIYPDGDREVIHDFSFDFVPGSRTAIVGETGAGKSTLIRIMLALLHPQKGTVLLYNDRQKIAASPLTRCNLVYVPQGNSLLSGTIRDNLLLGNPDASEDDLKNALTTAVAEFVYDLPDGLDTLCGERGAGLSEGQAQRICIARGLLRPGTILLLDEFSASLDKETERLLMERLIAQTKDKTLIFITHREMVTAYCAQVIKLTRTSPSITSPGER